MSAQESHVSLISTVLNEGANIDRFMDSIGRQSRRPDEVVIVDGGSTDDTVERIRSWVTRSARFPVRVIVDPTCSRRGSAGPIARGRNRAIREARHEIIACADAGCALHEHWLASITDPFQDPDVHVVGGWYQPILDSRFRRALALSWITRAEDVDPKTFIPSSRSLSFRRDVWQSVGGYPEHSLYGEDTMFIQRVRERGYRVELRRDALVDWEIPSDASSFARLAFRYGFGDGFSRIQGRAAAGNLLKLLVASALLAGGVLIHWSVLASLPILSGAYAMRRQLFLRHDSNALLLLPVVGIVKILSDASYLAGHVKGRVTRQHPLMHQST